MSKPQSSQVLHHAKLGDAKQKWTPMKPCNSTLLGIGTWAYEESLPSAGAQTSMSASLARISNRTVDKDEDIIHGMSSLQMNDSDLRFAEPAAGAQMEATSQSVIQSSDEAGRA